MPARMRLVAGGLAVMVVAAGGTWAVAAQVMRTPAQVAAEAEPPEPGPVTAPVERRAITSEVVTRATVVYDEPTAISVTGQPDVDGDAVVTRVPEEGDEVTEGEAVAEVSGRPLLVLEGALPAYRDLRPGASGDDVAQLQAGLDRLGHYSGDIDGRYGPATEAAVEAWYGDVGFEAPGLTDQQRQRLEAAEDARDNAAQQLDQAQRALRQARQGPSEAEILQAEQAVMEARQRVEETPPGTAGDEQANQQLAIARAQLERLRTGPDPAAEREAVARARSGLEEATAELEEVRAETGTWVPAAELAFLDEMPRRVESVEVGLGDEASGELLTVTQGEVVIESDVDDEDAELIDEGETVDIVPDEGDPLQGTVAEVGGGDGEGEGTRLVVAPADGANAQQLIDASVRLDVPVDRTEGEVLAVPLAALSVAADGDSRVQVVGEAADGGGQPVTEHVTVQPGLTAEGMAAVEPVGGELAEGDRVVVGTAGGEPLGEGPADAAGGGPGGT